MLSSQSDGMKCSEIKIPFYLITTLCQPLFEDAGIGQGCPKKVRHYWESLLHLCKYFVLARKRMGLVMTTQQIGSLYPRQLLQGSVNARPASFCRVFCDEKKFGHKKLSNVAQSSRPRTRPHLPCPCGPQGKTEALTKCQYMPSILWLEFQLLKLMRMTCKPVLLTVGWLAQM